MKVIAINGSPRADGNTCLAINAVGDELRKEGIDVEIVHVGNKPIRGCLGCMQCVTKKNEECSVAGDGVNEIIQQMKSADGMILASPVYFSGIAGTMKCFLDRVFLVAGVNDGLFRHKVGVSVVADRRAGGVSTYNQLNDYLHYSEMFMPSSNYWNVVFGRAPGEAQHDVEGLQTMRVLGNNMAWLMKSVAKGKDQFVLPEREQKVYLNFIR